MRSLVLQTVARGILPVAALFALYLLLRGHDLPGGGFIAGLVTAAAIVLQGLAFGVSATRQMLEPLLRPALAVGLGLAALTGFIGPLRGDPFMTHYHATVDLGQGGKVHLNTALLFDLGVYVAVVGVASVLLASFVASTGEDTAGEPP